MFVNDKNEKKLIEKIINIIMKIKLKRDIITDFEFKKNIIEELGKCCKKDFDELIYNDARLLYAVIINRNLEKNHKNIKSNIMRFLYYALEYHDNINTINLIVRDYKFEKYPIIYFFTGLIIGFEKLSKIYTDSQALSVFKERCNIQLSDILQQFNQMNKLNRYYQIDNKEILKKILIEKNYYNLIKNYCLNNKDKGVTIKRIRKSISIITINDKYKIFLYIKPRKKQERVYFLHKGKWKNTNFNEFRYCNINGGKLKYIDEIMLNNKLSEIWININL